MDWFKFKQRVDEKITEELGEDFDHELIEIDWIDISSYQGEVIIIKHHDGSITLQVS